MTPFPRLPPNQKPIWGKGPVVSSPKFPLLEFGGGREGVEYHAPTLPKQPSPKM
jgi:hypothetical protein